MKLIARTQHPGESFVEAPATKELSESAEALEPTTEEGMSATMAAYARALSRNL